MQEFVEKVSTLEDRIDRERKEKYDRVKKYEEEIEKLKDRLYSNPSENQNDSTYSNRRYSSSYTNRYLTFGNKNPTGT